MGPLVVQCVDAISGVVGIVLYIMFLAEGTLRVFCSEMTICFQLPRAQSRAMAGNHGQDWCDITTRVGNGSEMCKRFVQAFVAITLSGAVFPPLPSFRVCGEAVFVVVGRVS